jgi:hypothetical protein
MYSMKQKGYCSVDNSIDILLVLESEKNEDFCYVDQFK